MTTEKREKLAIERFAFEMAFDRDVDADFTYETTPYLDRETGAVLWVYEDDDEAEDEANIPAAENRALREAVAAAPARYLEIPGLEVAARRYLGILLTQIGVATDVAVTAVSIVFSLSAEEIIEDSSNG